MLELDFSGWFQCRLATDPDPVDEPRGVSGWSFAVGDEPDLDRIIRFRKPLHHRTHAPPIGVRVRAVRIDGKGRPGHALAGAPVDLLDQPRFEGRNGLLAEDGREPIHPFRLDISTASIVLRREDWLDPANSAVDVVSPADLERRCGTGLTFGPEVTQVVLAATGQAPFAEWQRARYATLTAECADEDHPDARAPIETRLWALRDPVNEGKLRVSFGSLVSYAFALGEKGGRTEVEGDRAAIGGTPDADAPWPIRFWLGGWQADGLCGFIQGTLIVPFRAGPSAN